MKLSNTAHLIFNTHPLLTLLVLFTLGAILGSFISLLIYRLYHDEKGIINGRSRCPGCGKLLPPSALIPIVSWIIQRGKCKECGKPISAMYPLIELSFSILLATSYYLLATHRISALEIILIFFALILFWYDTWFMTVDRRISFGALALAFLNVFIYHPDQIDLYLLGGLIGGLFYFVQYFYSKGRWVGLGDTELGLFMGLILGGKMIWLALFGAYLLGIVSVLIFGILKGLHGKSLSIKGMKVPMGAFLMPSLMVFIIWGNQIWDWYWGLVLI